MPMEAEELAEMESLIGVARKRDLFFAVCMGKKPEGTIFMMHRMKDSGILARNAKKAGETAKIAWGTVRVKGKKIMLQCEEEPPANMARGMKMFLKDQGIPLKVSILDRYGEELESDGDEDEDGLLDLAGPDGGAPEPDADRVAGDAPAAAADDEIDAQSTGKERWEAIVGPLGALYEKAMKTNPPNRTTLEAAWAMANDKAEAGDYKTALTIAAKIKPPLEALAGTAQPQSDPLAPKWAALAGPLGALYEKAMKNNPANRSSLEAAWAMAREKAGGGDYKSAMAIAAKLKPALDAALAAGPAAEGVPAGVVAFQRSRIEWQNTRKSMFSEMKRLENAIAAACAGDPELEEIVSSVSELTGRLGAFDERLEDILDQITVTPEGSDRDALKRQAVAAISDYRNALNDDFFKDVDSNNGFLNVSIASAATNSLASIAKTLAG